MHLMHMPCTLLHEPLHQEYTVRGVHTHREIEIFRVYSCAYMKCYIYLVWSSKILE